MHMWNDSNHPLAFLITFRCYGTWLHGDELGSIDRRNNIYGDAKIAANDHWKVISSNRMKQRPVRLDAASRDAVERAVRDTCERRKWKLYATNIRTNHIHVVTTTGGKLPSVALNAFKANATRCLRESGLWLSDRTPWADKGSERWLWTDDHIFNAVEYVLKGHGDELPKFD